VPATSQLHDPDLVLQYIAVLRKYIPVRNLLSDADLLFFHNFSTFVSHGFQPVQPWLILSRAPSLHEVPQTDTKSVSSVIDM
jgi:hypothetical protein